MTVDFHALANASIRRLMPYQPGKPISELQRETGVENAIKLASNENPLGPSPSVIQALTLGLNAAHIYPDTHCFELKQILAKKLSISADQLTIGNGSENILELIVKCYLQQDDHAVLSQYAFIVIPILLQSYGVQAKVVPASKWGHDINKMIKAIDNKTRVLFIVNPNNPTGTYITEKEFIELMESVPQQVLVVIDEAYQEYMTHTDYPNTLEYLSQYPNLVITRTFSKLYGLAGLRIGYAIASPTITDILHRARATFAVNSLAAIAARAALSDEEHVKKTLLVNQKGLCQLQTALTELKLKFISPTVNFITLNVGNGPYVYEKLCQQGIIVRPLLPYNMQQYIRVSVGTYEQNDRFISVLQQLIADRQIKINHTLTEEVSL